MGNAHADHHEEEVLPHGTLTPGKFCMWLFLGSDAMGFATLICSYLVLRMASPQWVPDSLPLPPIELTGFSTFVLIVSSLTMVMAYSAVCDGRIRALQGWLFATFLGGVIFLACQAYEYSHLIHQGLTMDTSPYAATFYTITGYHGLHVLAGVIYIGCYLIKALRGKIKSSDSSEIEVLGLYWHFVDLVWIFVFTVIDLIP